MPLPDERLCGDWTYRQKSSARRAGELQCLGDMPWVSRATSMWPDSRYLVSEESYVNTSNNLRIVIAGCTLRSVVIDHVIADSAKLLLPHTSLHPQRAVL